VKKLSAIIPLHTSDFRSFKTRLDLRLNCDLEEVEVILVDDVSPGGVANEIQVYCQQHGFIYQNTGIKNQAFSLSRARNTGLMSATCEWLLGFFIAYV